MFAVRTKIMKELIADPEWCDRLERAERWSDVERVVMKYCRAKGFKVAEVLE